jgi:hypothetical protein
MNDITDAREIKTGDCLLVSSKSWLARQIQKFQKMVDKDGGKWNHAAMFWWAYDELMVIEAEKYGIRITPFKDYVESDKDLLVLKPKFDVDGSEYGKFMLPYAGSTRYGFWNLVVAQSVRILTMGRVWLGPSKKHTRRFTCGEWCQYVYDRFNPGVVFPDWNEGAPVDLWRSFDFTHHDFKRMK